MAISAIYASGCQRRLTVVYICVCYSHVFAVHVCVSQTYKLWRSEEGQEAFWKGKG